MLQTKQFFIASVRIGLVGVFPTGLTLFVGFF